MIVIDVLQQQQRVLSALQDYLNPGSFKRPTIVRKMRFEFEEKGIERIRTSIREQLRYCAELRARAKVLAVQNVHLVETLQNDSGRAILVFTFISVFFLPLSFVASFFGMNVVGITGTASTVWHFWAIALPITAGIMTIGGTSRLLRREYLVCTCEFAAYLPGTFDQGGRVKGKYIDACGSNRAVIDLFQVS